MGRVKRIPSTVRMSVLGMLLAIAAAGAYWWWTNGRARSESEGAKAGEAASAESKSGVESKSGAAGERKGGGDEEESAKAKKVIVRGKVVDEAGVAAGGAVITRGVEDSVTADEAGEFEIEVPAESVWILLTVRDRTGTKIQHQSVDTSEAEEKVRPGIDEPVVVKLIPTYEVEVRVVDQERKPVVGATVVAKAPIVESDVRTTDASGVAKVRLQEGRMPVVVAFKGGVGLDYFSSIIKDEDLGIQLKNRPKIPEKLELVLDGAKRVRVKVVDEQGKPVAGASAGPYWIVKEGNPGKVYPKADIATKRTDERGIAEIDWLPVKAKREVSFSAYTERGEWGTVEVNWRRHTEEHLYTLTVKNISRERSSERIAKGAEKKKDSIEVRGRVVGPEGGPVVGGVVKVNGQGMIESAEGKIEWERFAGETKTDEGGRFAIRVPVEMAYAFYVRHNELMGYMKPIVVLKDQAASDVEIKLTKGHVVRGRVTVGDEDKPAANQWVEIALELGEVNDSIEVMRKRGKRGHYGTIRRQESMTTDANGEYRFLVPPGHHSIRGPSRSVMQHENFTIREGDGERVLDYRLPREEFRTLTGVVRDLDGKPVAHAAVRGVYEYPWYRGRTLSGDADGEGRFSIECQTERAVVLVRSADRKLGTIVELDENAKGFEAEVRPTYSARGGVVDAEGRAVADAGVEFSVRIKPHVAHQRSFQAFKREVFTDGEGKFEMEHLIPGVEYEVVIKDGETGKELGKLSLQQDDGTTADMGEVWVGGEEKQGGVK